MVDQKLVGFIKKMLKDRISLNTIKTQLKEKGWSESEINNAIQSAIPSETPIPKIYCWSCGTENDATVQNCKNCGFNLTVIPKEEKEKPKSYCKIILLILLLLILVSISVWFGMKGIVKILEEKGQATLQRNTEETARIAYICATDVIFDIKSVCKSGNNYNIAIQNDGKENINGWKIGLHISDNDKAVESLDANTSVPAHGMAVVTITPTTVIEVREVWVSPVIEKAGKTIYCSGTVDVYEAYGDARGPIITSC